MRTPKSFVQYGCGLSAPTEWVNFDVSPTLRLAKIPLLGSLITRNRVRFPENVKYGDVTRGLPIDDNHCDGVFASHVLEHLALDDFYSALTETKRILKPGGRFRLIVPDLEKLAEQYLMSLQEGGARASHQFMSQSYLGLKEKPKSFLKRIVSGFGNTDHLWMWDRLSMKAALEGAGFSLVRPAAFGDSEETAFSVVEEEARFDEAIAFEAIV